MKIRFLLMAILAFRVISDFNCSSIKNKLCFTYSSCVLSDEVNFCEKLNSDINSISLKDKKKLFADILLPRVNKANNSDIIEFKRAVFFEIETLLNIKTMEHKALWEVLLYKNNNYCINIDKNLHIIKEGEVITLINSEIITDKDRFYINCKENKI